MELAGLTPLCVRRCGAAPRLQWRIGAQLIETDFARFRPVQLLQLRSGKKLGAVWQDFADLPMTDPFFKNTRDKARALPGHADPFTTDWEIVGEVAAQPGHIPLSGTVFHMARSGSTLVHRLLSRSGAVLSLSEVGIMERALLLATNWPESARNSLLRDTIGVFGRPRRPVERHYVVKMTDGIPNTRLPEFRAAFSAVPWIFVYRNPVEIMVSILREPTGNLQSWRRNRTQVAQVLRMPGLANPSLGAADYLARTLRRYCAMAIQAARRTPPGLFLAVDYARLPHAVWETIAPHFGITLSATERERMQAEARFSAKLIGPVEFQPDSRIKQQQASPRMHFLTKHLVEPLITELKALPQG